VILAAALIVSVALMLWLWRSGGVRFAAPAQQAAIEECGVTLSGSPTVGLTLAPTLVVDFLTQAGYVVDPPHAAQAGVTAISGRRGSYVCSVLIRVDESTTGIADLASGSALIALSARPVLPAEIETLKQANAGDFEAERQLAEHVVALDAFVMAVHRSNSVNRLTETQVDAILTGRQNNWAGIGPEQRPLTVYLSADMAGADDFPNDVLPTTDPLWVNASTLPHFRVVASDRAVLEGVARDPNGIGAGSGAFPRDQRRLRDIGVDAGTGFVWPTHETVTGGGYPFMRRLFFYVRPQVLRENRFVQRFVSYAASPQARARIVELGFAPPPPSASTDAAAIGCFLGTVEAVTLVSALHGFDKSDMTLRFRPASFELDEASQAAIQTVATQLSQHIARGQQVTLVGHSDIAGANADNRELGMRRALAARAALERRGVYGLRVESGGESCPVADFQTEEGQRLNRRVDVWISHAG
jgi:ABC-type phosphate transport system substrate-binding protein